MSKYGKFLALAMVLVLVVGVAALAGCTPSTPSGGTSGTTTQPGADLKLVTPGTITVGSDTAFPPFETMNGTTAQGFDVDLIAAMAKTLGLQSVFKSEKFDTLIPQLTVGGKFDMVASAMTITDERKQQVNFTSPYIDSNQSLAVRKDSTIKSATELSGKNVGVQAGTTGEAWAKENIKSAKIVPFDDALAAFSALQAGKVDGVVNDLPVTAYLVKDPARQAKIVQEIPTGEQYGFAVAKTNPALLAALDGALAKVKASGEYATIYTKWFGIAPPK